MNKIINEGFWYLGQNLTNNHKMVMISILKFKTWEKCSFCFFFLWKYDCKTFRIRSDAQKQNIFLHHTSSGGTTKNSHCLAFNSPLTGYSHFIWWSEANWKLSSGNSKDSPGKNRDVSYVTHNMWKYRRNFIESFGLNATWRT